MAIPIDDAGSLLPGLGADGSYGYIDTSRYGATASQVSPLLSPREGEKVLGPLRMTDRLFVDPAKTNQVGLNVEGPM
jgi:hypothetical protein